MEKMGKGWKMEKGVRKTGKKTKKNIWKWFGGNPQNLNYFNTKQTR